MGIETTNSIQRWDGTTPPGTDTGIKKADGGFSTMIEKLSISKTPQLQNNIRDVVYIGVGAATAYSLSVRNQETLLTQKASDQPFAGKISIIGRSDAWEASVRGGGDINHQHELIDHWGTHAPEFKKEVASREEFNKQNAGQIMQAVEMGAEAIANSVKHIQREADGTFSLTLADDTQLKTKKVVVATGAGAHTALDQANYHPNLKHTKAEVELLKNNHISLPEKLQEKTMDLDTFMRETDDPKSNKWVGKTIVVHGPNAGIDAVERAGQLGAKVEWLSRTSNPVLLDGNALKYANGLAKNVIKASDLNITPTEDGQLKLDIKKFKTDANNAVIKDKITGKEIIEGNKTIIADLYVYAMGQDANSVDRKTGEVAVGGFLKDLIDALEPQYDTNQVFGDKPYETVLGFQVKNDDAKGYLPGTGLEVIGAAASNIAAGIGVKHNYLEKSLADLDATAYKDLGTDQGAKLMEAVKSGDKELALTLVKAAQKTHAKNPLGLDEKSKEFIAQSHVLRHVEKSVERYFEADDYFNPKAKDGAEAPPKRDFVKNDAMDAPTRTLVATVVQSAQLGVIKANVAALGSFVPEYVLKDKGEVNFSTDNRNQLRIFIANNYPNITETQATKFINDVIATRHLRSEDAQAARSGDLLGQVVRAHKNNPFSEANLAQMLSEGGVRAEASLPIAQSLLATLGALQDPTAPRGKDGNGKEIALGEATKKAVKQLSDSWASSTTVVPALGTPEKVRIAYVAELQRLNGDNQATNTPAVRAWVKV